MALGLPRDENGFKNAPERWPWLRGTASRVSASCAGAALELATSWSSIGAPVPRDAAAAGSPELLVDRVAPDSAARAVDGARDSPTLLALAFRRRSRE